MHGGMQINAEILGETFQFTTRTVWARAHSKDWPKPTQAVAHNNWVRLKLRSGECDVPAWYDGLHCRQRPGGMNDGTGSRVEQSILSPLIERPGEKSECTKQSLSSIFLMKSTFTSVGENMRLFWVKSEQGFNFFFEDDVGCFVN